LLLALGILGKAYAKFYSVVSPNPKKRGRSLFKLSIYWNLKGVQTAGEKDLSRQAKQLNLLFFNLKDGGN
jgi:hypothetical protein